MALKFSGRNAENGSAIVYVFVGIALFGALMFMFSRGGSQNAQGFTKQQSVVKAQSIIEYGNAVAAAVNKLASNGISENDISFATDIFKTKDGTIINPAGKFPNCAVATCKVFDTQGGKVTALYPADLGSLDSTSANSAPLRGALIAHTVSVIDVGTSLPELVLSFHSIPREVCAEINNLLDNKFTTNPPVGDSVTNSDEYTGAFPSSFVTIGDSNDSWAESKSAYCYQFSSSIPDMFVYQKVAIAR